VFASVYYPSNVALKLDDPTLNRVLPINSAPPPPGCSDTYQTTSARAFADWSNGGSGSPADSLQNVDISRHVTLASSDTSAALVMGTTVKVRRRCLLLRRPAVSYRPPTLQPANQQLHENTHDHS
jgi:hypothetical protein